MIASTRDAAETRDGTDKPTVCVLCSHNCGLRVDVEDGRIAAVRGDEANPITHGYVCNKAFSIARYVDHGQRVQHPLRRRPDGTFERVSWDDAIRDIADRLGAIRAQHTGRAIGLVGIGGQANHMDAPYGLGFLAGLGSRRWFNAFAQEKTQHPLVDNWMLCASPSVLMHPDQAHTRFMLVLGTNPRITNRGHKATEVFKGFAQDPERTVVVVDPRVTDTTKNADEHIQLRPGTDCYLLLGMLAVIVDGGLVDAHACRERAVGFDDLRAAISDVDVGDMARRCGIERDQLVRVATKFAQSPSASVLMDLGAEHTRFSTLNAYLVRVLLAVTGNLGTKGGNVYLQSFNPPGAGKTRGKPERALVSGIEAIRALGNYAMFSPSLVPEEVMADHPHRLRALIVEGSNPLLSFADTSRWRAAVERLDLLVVIDPAMTETARAADYVLPTPVGYEKWEVSGFPTGFPEIKVQVRPPVVPPPADALPEPEIYARLAEAMDLFGPPPKALQWLAPKAARSAHAGGAFLIAAMAAARRAGRGGLGVQNRMLFWTYRTLGAHLRNPSLAAIWLICHMNALTRRDAVLRTLGPTWRRKLPHQIAAELFERIMAHPEGVELAVLSTEDNLGDTIEFDDGKVRLLPDPIRPEIRRAIAEPEQRSTDYPFVLAAGVRTRWTANTIQRDPAWRKGKGPHCELGLSVADAERLGIATGATVRVETRRGAVELPARVDERMREGHVAIPNGFGTVWDDGVVGVNVNELTAAEDRDPFTGCPHHKYVPCRVSVV